MCSIFSSKNLISQPSALILMGSWLSHRHLPNSCRQAINNKKKHNSFVIDPLRTRKFPTKTQFQSKRQTHQQQLQEQYRCNPRKKSKAFKHPLTTVMTAADNPSISQSWFRSSSEFLPAPPLYPHLAVCKNYSIPLRFISRILCEIWLYVVSVMHIINLFQQSKDCDVSIDIKMIQLYLQQMSCCH